jgi:mannosyltransferase
LWLPLAIGTVLRLIGLTRQSLWVDEIMTLNAASVGQAFRFRDVLADPQGPLPHVILRLWTAVGGSGDLSLRLWAVTAGVLGLALAAVTFRRVLPRAATLGTWLFALSPFHIWYSQEVRNYAFLIAASAVVLWTLVRALERSTPGRWVAHGAALAVLMLCNLSGAVLLPVIGIFLLLDHRDRLLPWAVAAAAGLAVVSPWFVVEFTHHVEWSEVAGTGGEAVRGNLTFHPGALPFTYATFLGGFGLGPPLRALHAGPRWSLFVPYLPGLLLGAVGSATAVIAAARGLHEPRMRLLFIWAFLPALGIAAVAVLGLKAYNPRYLAVSQPVFLLVLAEGIRRIGGRRRAWGVAVAAALVIPMAVGWAQQTFNPRYGREDYRGAGTWLEGRTRPGDLILQEGVVGVVGRYYRGPAEISAYYPIFFEEPGGGRARLNRLIAGHPRVWWVGARLWYVDPSGKVVGWLAGEGTPVGSWEHGGIEVRGFVLSPEESSP